MPLARFDKPFEHADWIFEPKLDGFRAIAYIEDGVCQLVSRNRNAFKTFAPLAEATGQELAPHAAILDGEIVRLGPDGRPLFYELMRRRGPFCFYAFDLVWLDGSDLRDGAAAGAEEAPAEARAALGAYGSLCGACNEWNGPLPCDLRPRHGGDCREAGERQVHAGSDDLGQDQEPTV
jgi:hypothetical protein